LAARAHRQLQRRVQAAQFHEHKTLEDFDWSFNPSIKRKQNYDLRVADSFARPAMCSFWHLLSYYLR